MRFHLDIELSNVAMQGSTDVSDVLRTLADRLLRDSWHLGDPDPPNGKLRDVNGNSVGEWAFDDSTRACISAERPQGPPVHFHSGGVEQWSVNVGDSISIDWDEIEDDGQCAYDYALDIRDRITVGYPDVDARPGLIVRLLAELDRAIESMERDEARAGGTDGRAES